MPQPTAIVTLDHKTGPVTVTISGQSPEVTAYIANRFREVFKVKSGKTGDALADALAALNKEFRL